MRRNNYFSIPLIIITSSTGITSLAQLTNKYSNALVWTTAITGAVSAALASVQRYFRYGERAEQCKNMAKTYGIYGSKLETKRIIYESKGGTEKDFKELVSFAEHLRNDMEDLLRESDDAPYLYRKWNKKDLECAIAQNLPRQDTITESKQKTPIFSPLPKSAERYGEITPEASAPPSPRAKT